MFVIRRINRHGQISFRGKKWEPKYGDSTVLAGQYWAFGIYGDPGEHNDDLICLWGTAAYFYYDGDPDGKLGNDLFIDSAKRVSIKPPIMGMEMPSGTYSIAKNDMDEWVSYSQDIAGFWKPVSGSGRGGE